MKRSDVVRLVMPLSMLAVLACKARVAPPAPRPLEVHPSAGFSTGTDVVIAGEGFEIQPVHSLDGAHSAIDARYRAWVGPAELTDVVWIDDRTLRAHVPATLALGRYDVSVEGPSGTGVLPGGFEVIAGAPAVMTAAIPGEGAAAVGDVVDVAITVSNLGEATISAVQAEMAVTGAGALAVVAAPVAQDVPAGASRTFVFRFRATAAGDVTLAASVTGTDPRTGGIVSASASGHLAVQLRAQIAVTVSLPGGPIALGELPVTVTLANVGTATAQAVTVSTPTVTPSSTAAAVPVVAPQIEATLGSGESRAFTWTYRAIASGSLQVETTASWADDLGIVRSAGAISGVVRVLENAEVIAVDPLGDGSPFAFVAGYRGQLVVGPNRTGTAIARTQLDGTGLERLALSFGRDQTGSNVASNTAPPYASIGFTGCTPNSAVDACGPDDEDGRGLLTSASFAGDEWLVLGGARSGGELDYVYLSRATTSPLAFSYVDVGGLLGAATRGFTAAAVSGDRLYLGFADNGGNRPYGLALLTAPPATTAGLDAVQGTDALELGLHTAYDSAYHAFTTISMIDSIADLNGRVYFFNNSGCLGARTATPASSADFFACSPTAGVDYDLTAAVAPPRQYDLEPRDRAWPQVAVWNGRLFAIRNTTTGPQLWCCDPVRRGDPLACDPSDWYLVAPDVAYRTRLGKATATSATLLVATPTHLLVGFDDPSAGIHVFRTSVATPIFESDFTGRDGCLAGTAGCEGLGGDGLGAPGQLVRIFDAKAIAVDGRTDVYLTAGDGAGPVEVVRLSP
jgi:hypothetical protein